MILAAVDDRKRGASYLVPAPGTSYVAPGYHIRLCDTPLALVLLTRVTFGSAYLRKDNAIQPKGNGRPSRMRDTGRAHLRLGDWVLVELMEAPLLKTSCCGLRLDACRDVSHFSTPTGLHVICIAL